MKENKSHQWFQKIAWTIGFVFFRRKNFHYKHLKIHEKKITLVVSIMPGPEGPFSLEERFPIINKLKSTLVVRRVFCQHPHTSGSYKSENHNRVYISKPTETDVLDNMATICYQQTKFGHCYDTKYPEKKALLHASRCHLSHNLVEP